MKTALFVLSMICLAIGIVFLIFDHDTLALWMLGLAIINRVSSLDAA